MCTAFPMGSDQNIDIRQKMKTLFEIRTSEKCDGGIGYILTDAHLHRIETKRNIAQSAIPSDQKTFVISDTCAFEQCVKAIRSQTLDNAFKHGLLLASVG